MYVNSPAFYAGCLRSLLRTTVWRKILLLRWLLVSILLLPIPLDESFLIRLLVRCFDMLFPVRTPLHNLFAFVHPKVVSVFSKLSSQRIDGYNYFCYHISPFFVLLRIESVVSSRPFRDHPERHAYVRDPFFKSRCKYTMNKLYFANFFATFLHNFLFFFALSRKIAKLHNNVASTISNR